MTQLYLLRHAHAGDATKWKGDDAERPLTEKGIRQAERLGRFLSQVGFRPDTIVSSPKLRAFQTAEIVGRLVRTDVAIDERLASGAGISTVEQILAELDADRPMLVGHDPDFSMLVNALCDSHMTPMRKGALARIDVSHPVKAGAGTLRWLIPPDLLRTEESPSGRSSALEHG
ncbi:MAG: phosphohistidine phosphatase SixA [Candidatus Limnocylindrales bacterium]